MKLGNTGLTATKPAFDPSLYESHPDTFYALESETIAEDWLYLMQAVETMNDWRGSGSPKLRPDVDLTWAANTMAVIGYTGGDVAEGVTWTDMVEIFRPDGFEFGTCAYGSVSFSRLLEELATDEYAGRIPSEDSATYAGQIYDSVGLAHYLDEDGDPFWIVLLVID